MTLKFLQVPRVNWNAVVESLDNDALYVPDQNSFTALIRMISTLSSVSNFCKVF